MIEREIANKLRHLVATFPVVTIEGPRQSGKTTLARMVFPDYAYANLEDGATRRLAERDPQSFFEKFPCPAIVDEIQRVPDLLSAIQFEVDRRGGNGLFVLTGSHQPRLREGVSQSLAGRTALLTLLTVLTTTTVPARLTSMFVWTSWLLAKARSWSPTTTCPCCRTAPWLC